MRRIVRTLRFLLARFRDCRGVTLYETTAVVAMTTIVASVAIPMTMDRIEEAKETKAARELLTLANAMMKFRQDTRQWPGEEKIGVVGGAGPCFLQSGVPTSIDPTLGTPLPDFLNIGFFDATVFIGRSCVNFSPSTALDINDYLVRRPSVVDFPDWQGPYMEPVISDPWDRAYIINVLPLIFGGEVAIRGQAGLSEIMRVLGNGWILSVGPDRLLETPLNRESVAAGSDDIGKNLGRASAILPGA
ncbi:MAG: hypothetical protein ACE5JD_00270 [Candidatus Methylomirabilia bacterium]